MKTAAVRNIIACLQSRAALFGFRGECDATARPADNTRTTVCEDVMGIGDRIGRCNQNESETDIVLETFPFFTTALLLTLAFLTCPLVTTLDWRIVCVMPTTALWLMTAS